MEMEVDFVNHDDALVLDELLARWARFTNVVEEVPQPAQKGAIAVGQSGKRHQDALLLVKVFTFGILSAGELPATLGDQPVDELFYLDIPPAQAAAFLVARQPGIERAEREILLEETHHPRRAGEILAALFHPGGSGYSARGSVPYHEKCVRIVAEHRMPRHFLRMRPIQALQITLRELGTAQ